MYCLVFVTLFLFQNVLANDIYDEYADPVCDFWIDANANETGSGTQDDPWNNITYALDNVTDLTPVFCVLPGDYRRTSTLTGAFLTVVFLGIPDMDTGIPSMSVTKTNLKNATFINIKFDIYKATCVTCNLYLKDVMVDAFDSSVGIFVATNVTVKTQLKVAAYGASRDYVNSLSDCTFYGAVSITRGPTKISNCNFVNITTRYDRVLDLSASFYRSSFLIENTKFLNNLLVNFVPVGFIRASNYVDLVIRDSQFICNHVYYYYNFTNQYLLYPPIDLDRNSRIDALNYTVSCGNEALTCEIGKFLQNPLLMCVLCPSGNGWNTTSKTTCIGCPPGSYATTVNSIPTCEECEDGRITEQSNSTYCYFCSSGSISNINHTECTECPADSFQEKNLCISCPLNATSEPGSTECEPVACDIFHGTFDRCNSFTLSGKLIIVGIAVGGAIWIGLTIYLLMHEIKRMRNPTVQHH